MEFKNMVQVQTLTMECNGLIRLCSVRLMWRPGHSMAENGGWAS